MKSILKQYFTKNTFGKKIYNLFLNSNFVGSEKYWEKRYKNNGDSGVGSYGIAADYKANFINNFVLKQSIDSVVELGCGDGNQLKQLNFKNYIGFDVSPTIITKCKEIFADDKTKRFYHFDIFHSSLNEFKHDLTISLDVIYHLIEDEVFEKYMHSLFQASKKWVIIYSWDVEGKRSGHVRQRNFSKWVHENIKDFEMHECVKSPSFCDFVVYKKVL